MMFTIFSLNNYIKYSALISIWALRILVVNIVVMQKVKGKSINVSEFCNVNLVSEKE